MRVWPSGWLSLLTPRPEPCTREPRAEHRGVSFSQPRGLPLDQSQTRPARGWVFSTVSGLSREVVHKLLSLFS